MANSIKYPICQSIVVIGTFCATGSLYKVINYGLAGDSHHVKLWFALFICSILSAISAAFALYIYKDQRSSEIEKDNISMQTLSNLADSKNQKKSN